MSRNVATLAILFADIAGSTKIYETLGSKMAQDFVGSCLSTLTEVTLQHKGNIIKTIGDEIMCTFAGVDDAVIAAKAMHHEIDEIAIPDTPGFWAPNIYVGIQLGEVVEEKGDVFGDAVNVAARMEAMADQRQILTTEETVKALSPELRDSANCIDRTTLKGKSGQIDIYEIVWEQHDVTMMLDAPLENPARVARLKLDFGGHVIEVSQDRPSATLGRQAHNDIVVTGTPVSRTHARIECRRGKFILVDQSTNGTFMLLQGGDSRHIKRDEVSLKGNGLIGLGQNVSPESAEAIRFSVYE